MNSQPWFHPTAIVESNSIGAGTKVWAFSHVCAGASIGNDCVIGEGVHIGKNVTIGNRVKIQNSALIYEGVTIEDDVFIGPGVVTTNDIYPMSQGDWSSRFRETLIKKGASIGANSTIVCGNTVGENSMVGAGSVVVRHVANNATVVGNPARQISNRRRSA